MIQGILGRVPDAMMLHRLCAVEHIYIISLALCCRARRMPAGAAPLYAVLAMPLGVACSRVLFCLLDGRFRGIFSLRAMLCFWGGGRSMVGALLGAALAAVIAASLIAAVTFVICFAGLFIGKKVGTRLAGRASILGGVILVLIGIEIFVSSFF